MSQQGAQLVKDHVIVALDVDDFAQATALVETLGEAIDRYKVGNRLFTMCGPQILRELTSRGKKIFLDLKFHDIPSVVESACRQAASYEGVFLMTVHALGGRKMLEGARRAVEGTQARVVAVTALTSMSEQDVRDLGVECGVTQWAADLAEIAMDAEVHGMVCSPMEVAMLRELYEDALLITPGIRPSPTRSEGDDQTRVMTPSQALELGSSYLVIGRPIRQAADPLQAVRDIAEQLV